MYFGPLTADESGHSDTVAQPNHDREDAVTTRLTITQDGVNILRWKFDEDDERTDQQISSIVDVLNGHHPTRPRRTLSPEYLQRVADAWNSAPDNKRNEAVRDALGITRQDATNYVGRCRAKGLIPPVAKRRRNPLPDLQGAVDLALSPSFEDEMLQALAAK